MGRCLINKFKKSLLPFKQHFTWKGLLNLCIGKIIFDREADQSLIKFREKRTTI